MHRGSNWRQNILMDAKRNFHLCAVFRSHRSDGKGKRCRYCCCWHIHCFCFCYRRCRSPLLSSAAWLVPCPRRIYHLYNDSPFFSGFFVFIGMYWRAFILTQVFSTLPPPALLCRPPQLCLAGFKSSNKESCCVCCCDRFFLFFFFGACWRAQIPPPGTSLLPQSTPLRPSPLLGLAGFKMSDKESCCGCCSACFVQLSIVRACWRVIILSSVAHCSRRWCQITSRLEPKCLREFRVLKKEILWAGPLPVSFRQ